MKWSNVTKYFRALEASGKFHFSRWTGQFTLSHVNLTYCTYFMRYRLEIQILLISILTLALMGFFQFFNKTKSMLPKAFSFSSSNLLRGAFSINSNFERDRWWQIKTRKFAEYNLNIELVTDVFSMQRGMWNRLGIRWILGKTDQWKNSVLRYRKLRNWLLSTYTIHVKWCNFLTSCKNVVLRSRSDCLLTNRTTHNNDSRSVESLAVLVK